MCGAKGFKGGKGMMSLMAELMAPPPQPWGPANPYGMYGFHSLEPLPPANATPEADESATQPTGSRYASPTQWAALSDGDDEDGGDYNDSGKI